MLHYETSGSAGQPTIVFLHGIGMDSWMWGGATAGLGDFHCLVVDLPGHGGSRDVPWVSLEDTALMVDELVREVATDGRAHLVGISLGAYVGLTLAARRGPVDRAILSGLHVEPVPRQWLVRASTSLLAPLAKTSFVLRLGAQALRIPADEYDRYIAAARAVPTQAFRTASVEAATYELPANARHIETPLLAIAGEHETPAVHASLHTLQSVIPSCRAAGVPGAGHAWPIEAPDLCARTVRAWCGGDVELPAEIAALPEG